MFVVYIISAIVGLGLVLVTAFAGDHGGDSFDADADFDGDLGADHGHGVDSALPFLSLRFWTYFFAGFGLTGVLLHWLTKTGEPLAAGVSAAVGMLIGIAVVYGMRAIRSMETTLNTTELNGSLGKVTVAVDSENLGKVRVSHNGEYIDLFATSYSGDRLELGTQIIVVNYEDGKALVMPADELMEITSVEQLK